MLQKITLRPGVNREGTTLANEGGWYAGDKIRFRSGQVEKIGGWTLDQGTVNTTGQAYLGVGRSLKNWIGLTGYNYLGIGTNSKFYIQSGISGFIYDVTPIRATSAAGAATFAASTGSSIITVTQASHGALDGDYVTFTSATSLGGNITAAVLNYAAGYQITYINANSYSIIVSATANSSDTNNGGGSTIAKYQIHVGAVVYSSNLGWGAGGWGGVNYTITNTGWGSPAPIAQGINTQLRLWSQANYGQNLVFNPRGGALYYWVVDSTNANTFNVGQVLSSTNNNVQNATASLTTTGASSTTGTATLTFATQATAPFTVGSTIIVTGITPTGFNGTFTVTACTTTSVSYANSTAGPQTVAGNVNNGTKYWLTDSSCPTIANYVMVSDSSRFVIAFGTDTYGNGVQNPMLISWSDQQDITTWTPSITNQAGNFTLSRGSQIVSATQNRQEIIVFTDIAIYSMQYLGAPYFWGFNIIGDNISIMGPNTVATANNVTYWMGKDKFFMYSGQLQTLPCTLRSYVFQDINIAQSYQFFAGINEGFNEIWWFYCSENSNVIDKYVIYNHLEQTWYYGNLTRTAWADAPLRKYPTTLSYSPATTTTQDVSLTDTTINVTSTTNFPNVGEIQIAAERIYYTGLTSTTFTGCQRGYNGTAPAVHLTGTEVTDIGVVQSGIIYHENGLDNGTSTPPTPIYSYIQSSDFDIGDGHNFGFVWRIIPDVGFNGSNVENPKVTFTVLPRRNPGANYGTSDLPAVTSAQNYIGQSTYDVQQFTEYAYCRLRGRQMSLIVSSKDLGVQWQLGVPRIDIKPDGRK